MPSFTKQAIVAALIQLLGERPLSKITVKDIVETCGINRNSFYYHFPDLPTLVETVLEDEADRMIAQHASLDNLEDCLTAAIDFAKNNKTAALHIFRSGSREAFDRYLDKICQYVVESYIDTVAKDIPIQPRDKAIIVKFFKYELVGFILDWMNDGMRFDIDDEVKRICELFEGATQTAFERSVKQQASHAPFRQIEKNA